jgi:hypothetical protein
MLSRQGVVRSGNLLANWTFLFPKDQPAQKWAGLDCGGMEKV